MGGGNRAEKGMLEVQAEEMTGRGWSQMELLLLGLENP